MTMAKIRVENIEKVFNRHSRNSNPVLKSISFELPEKGLVAIFGKSGSGKTTLLNIIGGLERADSGNVYIDGECTRGKIDRIRNEKIGFIFQNYYLESGYTITEILHNQLRIAGFKDTEEMNRRTTEALRLVDMERFKNKLGDALSGGQMQRVAIARAIVKGSDIILADEPTGNLDAENTIKIMDILKEISKDKLVVIVTHEISLIQRYADSHIKIVDGELVENNEIEASELALNTYAVPSGEHKDYTALHTFASSGSKRNGRLFRLKNIVHRNKLAGGERISSAGNIFKQIFILALAVIAVFFSFTLYEISTQTVETKRVDDLSVYTNLNSYSVLRRLDDNAYGSIDFFDTNMATGTFSYGGLASLSGFEETYIPSSVTGSEEVEYGTLPSGGEVLVSRALAQALKKKYRLAELQSDKTIILSSFNETYKISGIVAGEEKRIYFNMVDYVNFLGIFNQIQFSDVEEIFFKNTFGTVTYDAEIMVYDGQMDHDKVRVEINRSSLYKMISDSTQADYEINQTNIILKQKPYAIQLSNSKVYVEQFSITRDVMNTDIRIYVSADVLYQIFVYIAPNLNELSSNGNYYFQIRASGTQEYSELKNTLRDMGVTSVNIRQIYELENKELREDSLSGIYLYVLIIALLLIIYFFIEKSASIKNSKEYGVYRAIGVNRSNLLFKEWILCLLHNITSYFIYSLAAAVLIAVRYLILNAPVSGFIGIALAGFGISSVLMMGISLIPYLFVLTTTPSEILKRYDI